MNKLLDLYFLVLCYMYLCNLFSFSCRAFKRGVSPSSNLFPLSCGTSSGEGDKGGEVDKIPPKLSRGLGTLVLRHLRQAFHLIDIKFQTLVHAATVFRVSLIENGCLAQLNTFLGVAEMCGDVAQVLPVIIGHDTAV